MTDLIKTLSRARDVIFAVQAITPTAEGKKNLAGLVADLEAEIAAAGWRPIESAPQGVTIQLVRDDMYDVGYWDDDRYARKPRPFWRSQLRRYMGLIWMRDYPPTLWCPCQPLPAPPPTKDTAP